MNSKLEGLKWRILFKS